MHHLDALNEKYNLQNYSTHLKPYDLAAPAITENHQLPLPVHLQQQEYIKGMNYQDGEKANLDEPNNNTKNNSSSSSSYEDTIDYDDSIQNHDVNPKDMTGMKRNETEALKYKCSEYMKNFDNLRTARSHYGEIQPETPYNGGTMNDDFRMGSMEDRTKITEDGNSNDMRINYASSDDLNQTTASSDHGGDKVGSGSEDDGNMGKLSFS